MNPFLNCHDFACCIGVVSFIILQGLVWLAWKEQKSFETPSYAPWTQPTILAISTGLFVASTNHLIRILFSKFVDDTSPTLHAFWSALCVNSLSCTANVLIYACNWGGSWTSIFGLEMPAALMPVWLVNVPLMGYIVAATVDPHLHSWENKLSVLGHFLTIFFGGCAHFSSTHQAFTLWVSLSMYCGMAGPWAWYRAESACENLQRQARAATHAQEAIYEQLLLYERQRALSGVVAFLFPLFPAIYFLRTFGWISNDATFVGFLILSAFAKLFFSFLCMDFHLEVAHPSGSPRRANADNARGARRSQLRYLFHEIRGAMNAITIGVDLLTTAGKHANTENTQNTEIPLDKETIDQIKHASMVMVDTLDGAQTLQRIEDGAFDVVQRRFNAAALLERICQALTAAADNAGVTLSTTTAADLPIALVGDAHILRCVLTHLVSNAIRFSPRGGTVTVAASRDVVNVASKTEPGADSALLPQVPVLFTVTDVGKGICGKVAQSRSSRDVFTPYTAALRCGDANSTGISQQGSGLGLATCRELVRRLGGDLQCCSQPDRGTVLCVSLPLGVVEGTGERGGAPAGSELTEYCDSPVSSLSTTGLASLLRSGNTHAPPPTPPPTPTATGPLPPPAAAKAGEESKGAQDGPDDDVASSVSDSESDSDCGGNKSKRNDCCSAPERAPEGHGDQEGLKGLAAPNKASESCTTQNAAPAMNQSAPPCTTPFAQLSVLVVDDVAMHRKMLGKLLERVGVTDIAYAEDGAVAVDKVMRCKELNHFGLILLDNTMPNMTGTECAAALRAQGYSQTIVALTGNTLDEELHQFARAGADLVLTKPLVLAQLQAILDHLLQYGARSRHGQKLRLHGSGVVYVPEDQYFT